MANQVDVLGFSIDSRLPADLIKLLANEIIRRKKTVRVLQINPEMIVAQKRQPHNQALLKNVDIIVPNGVGIQWAAAYARKPTGFNFVCSLGWILFRPDKLKFPLAKRYTSSSFTIPLLTRLGEMPQTVRILVAGAPKGSDIETTASKIREFGDNLTVLSFDSSAFNSRKLSRLTELAEKFQPDLTILGIGYPVQEEAAGAIQSKINHGVILTEGGSFDYRQLGGRITRAPRWLRHIGLEWLWRLWQEPARLVRQLAIFSYLHMVFRSSRKPLR